MVPLETSAVCIEIPPRNSIHRRKHRSRRPEQRREVGRAGICLMRFQGTNHDVLKTKALGVLVRSDLRDFFASSDSQYQSALLDGLEMIAACNDAHVVPSSRQFNGEIATNRTSAINAEFHA